MTSAGILHHLDHGFEVLIVKLRIESRRRIGCADHVTGGGGIETAFLAALQQRRVEALEVRAFAAFDIDDLNVLAGLNLVGERGARGDALIEQRLGERFGQANDPFVVFARAAVYEGHQVGRRILPVGAHAPAGYGDDAADVLLRGEAYRIAGR